MNGFDTTIQMANLRRDELVRTADRIRTARRFGRRVRHGFSKASGRTA